ncbi:hypothetical protein MKW98_006078 [Papaver atlanticum]|uniref:Uncharacterized protein n=1 Tax=Papaver atlanticum TaxID=357466 RepID=A0AAD4XX88_9MAGN|nr:hypothetical protein MKW98_006078 [Papaver atlanticum]
MEFIPKPRDGNHQASWEAFLGEDSEYSDMGTGENSNNAAGLLPNPVADPQAGMPNTVESSLSEPSKVLRYFPIETGIKRHMVDSIRSIWILTDEIRSVKSREAGRIGFCGFSSTTSPGINQLHTTHFWASLKVDSGIWPESESFNEEGLGHVPKRTAIGCW